MQIFHSKNSGCSTIQTFLQANLADCKEVYYQLPPEELVRQAIEKGEGMLSSTGALVIDTGEFTGRSPKDRFIVKDEVTEATINWNEFNQPIQEKYFEIIFNKIMHYIKDKKLWIRDCYVCAKPEYRLNIRVVNENPCCNLFAYNMFLRPEPEELSTLLPSWYLVQLPHFFAKPETDGVKSKNFVIINFSEKIILIGGTQYTGEIKKAVFSILNFILPKEANVLSMHCAANAGKQGDTSVFFGLSGTGKTTLSTDPERILIGDDEHGWDDDSIFNFEGGCYAKTINLHPEKEPAIYAAIREGSIVENTVFLNGSNIIDFSSAIITENTRASYPIEYIQNAIQTSKAHIPKNIFFLTADAFGVFPAISKLTPAQAMYQFISGYTAKLAGTETGVMAPQPTFSACFGAPFMLLAPAYYAAMLGGKIAKHKVNVWMINTGWCGGEYGTGSRIKLEYTRAMISAAIEGHLDNVDFTIHPIFAVAVPVSCTSVPPEILNPQSNWKNYESYVKAANRLAGCFIKNFEKYISSVDSKIADASPQLMRV